MDMNLQSVALGMAGVIGSCVAVFHGILVQRLMVRPFEEFFVADERIAAPIRRIVPLLLHFSTISWFLGGLALEHFPKRMNRVGFPCGHESDSRIVLEGRPV